MLGYEKYVAILIGVVALAVPYSISIDRPIINVGE